MTSDDWLKGWLGMGPAVAADAHLLPCSAPAARPEAGGPPAPRAGRAAPGNRSRGSNFWRPVPLSLGLVLWLTAAVAAQPPEQRGPASTRFPNQTPGTQQPGAAAPGLNPAFEPLTIAEVVYSWVVVDLTENGELVVDVDGTPFTVALWPIAIPARAQAAGANARRYLSSLVGRKLQFSFRRHDEAGPASGHLTTDPARRNGGAGGASRPPSRSAYSDAVAALVQRGLARYCPDAGLALPHLERLEQQAKERSLGMWATDNASATLVECQRR